MEKARASDIRKDKLAKTISNSSIYNCNIFRSGSKKSDTQFPLKIGQRRCKNLVLEGFKERKQPLQHFSLQLHDAKSIVTTSLNSQIYIV